MASVKKLGILGSTGSIGVSTLDIVAAFPEQFEVVTLTAGNNLARLEEQIRRFRPKMVAVISADGAQQLKERLGADAPQILSGVEGLVACACHEDIDMVVSAIVGAAGLVPTMSAIETGKDIALANKETLVTAGSLVTEAVARHGVRLFPVDSEHSAIFQSLEGHRMDDVRRLILTASGGPFRNRMLADMASVTPADALAHPNWSMGRKISIDSATMMNKGLEVIEARWLFDVPAERIAVHIHPQSIVHSLVEYVDGAVIAQLGIPDMKTPIAYALSHPTRLPLDLPPLDLCSMRNLTFDEPDLERFPCLALAYEALAMGGTAPAVLNAANEIAVDAFLNEEIAFLDIARVIRAALQGLEVKPLEHIDQVLRADLWGRKEARRFIDARGEGATVC
ncbi:1-deoxy-D-xylulose-5-phosphate reductoisomerase [Syntrophotalea carbinolica DSM 2380]|uniref:1-deoxy-D-xylulose 5-phosphate reductoisomerase n=1 Tax=Syntrophotalea carbinolica (strain DSM 2380 / NBRC 103641 / GraBd1) TaxID=338963 RepID=Q3A3A1_SYNC1|nr:1-deoxy-D-xylulose-5-phosphate reductoisomerase [Syntrophotalea carbinolica]ABA89156.1 1-deoxy-D-xylulose-5-phosphate reductoisomerase [Syntrophotalea carbinolica DSM 2380]